MEFLEKDKSPITLLNKVWGFSVFKEKQEEIINSVLAKKDTLVILPTGGGKSLCYQIPGLIFEGITLVISPLIALMKDQVEQLRSLNIKAEMITGEMNTQEIVLLFDELLLGKIKFLYVSPERLETRLFKEKISRLPISLIAVDEAHCISGWGYDFRPSYLKISLIKELFPLVNIIALTATATQKVMDEIVVNLKLNTPSIYKSSYEQKNIAYSIKESYNKQEELVYHLNKFKGNSIVFIRNRKECEYVNEYLNLTGFKSTFYHSKISPLEKEVRLKKWLNNELDVVVATNAFGMGIDKPNVRNVFHLSIPDSMESYYQEVGRAGRDGFESRAFLFYNSTDIDLGIKLYQDKIPKKEEFQHIINRLYNEFCIGENELTENTFDFDSTTFSKKHKISVKKLIHTLNFLQQVGLIYVRLNQKESLFKVLVSSRESIGIKNKIYISVLDYLERISKNFYEYAVIDEYEMAFQLGVFKSKLKEILITLDKQGIIKYKLRNLATIKFLTNRAKNIIIENKPIWQLFKEINLTLFQKTLEINYFVQKKNICRKQLLLGYFNEFNQKKCNKCDVCLNWVVNIPTKITKQAILTYLSSKPFLINEILNYFNQFPQQIIIEKLEELIEIKAIKKSNFNYFHL